MQNVRLLLRLLRPHLRSTLSSLLTLIALVATDLALPRLLQRLVDRGIVERDRDLLLQTVLAMLAVALVGMLLAALNNALSVRIAEGVARDLRAALFRKIQRLSFATLDRQTTSALLVRLTSDVAAVKSATQVSLRIGTRAPLMMLGSFALMYETSARLALTLLPLLLASSLLVALFVARLEPLSHNVQRQLEAVNEVLRENITGARVVRAFERAQHEQARFLPINDALTRRSIEVMRTTALISPALTMCISLGVVLIISSGARSSSALSIGQVVAFTNYLLTTMSPLIMLAMVSNTWAAGFSSLSRVGALLNWVPDARDGAASLHMNGDVAVEVSLDEVAFRYGETHEGELLEGVSLSASQGETIAVLGATGAGKSTLLNLIAGLYEPDSGSVRVLGLDLRTLTRASLREHIAVVAQEPTLFSGTVRDNIAYGRPAAGLSDVERAARAAQAHDFIVRLPHGYDTLLEQRGDNLSGGQRQRIAIARALLLEPKVLILDDATSAVDAETECAIHAALATTKDTRITFVVTQRLPTLREADRIVLLDRGRVVAQGDHRELSRCSAIYREICDSLTGAEPATHSSADQPALEAS